MTVESISYERKSDAIHTYFESKEGKKTPVSRITYVSDDSTWTVWPSEMMFKGMHQTFSSLKAAEYYSLIIALEMDSLNWFEGA